MINYGKCLKAFQNLNAIKHIDDFKITINTELDEWYKEMQQMHDFEVKDMEALFIIEWKDGI